MKDVGEPCAGEPHARFDGGWLETDRGNATYAPSGDRRRPLVSLSVHRASRLPYHSLAPINR